MGRILKLLFLITLLYGFSVVGYVFLGDMTADKRVVTQPVILRVD